MQKQEKQKAQEYLKKQQNTIRIVFKKSLCAQFDVLLLPAGSNSC